MKATAASNNLLRRLGRAHPLLVYALRRFAIGIALLFVVAVFVYAATSVIPGDAASFFLGRYATPSSLAIVREQLHLDRPLPIRFAAWLGHAARGDFGKSLISQQSIAGVIGRRMTNTLILAMVTVLILFPVAIALGVAAGARAGSALDHSISTLTLSVIAVPEFVTGTILALVVGLKLGLVPPVSLVPPGESPLAYPSLLVLPVATLLLAGIAQTTRMVRASVADVMASEYVQMARLNGVNERRVILRHVLPNSLASTIQTLAFTLQWLLGGVVIVETVFQYPGIGQELVTGISERDVPLVQAVGLLLAAIYIGINIVADVLVVILIPKMRTAL